MDDERYVSSYFCVPCPPEITTDDKMGRNRSWKPKASKSTEKKNKQQQQDHPPPKQQRQSSRGGLGQNATSGNTWAGGDAAKRDGKAASMPQDEHIPVNGFNAQEAREALKQGTTPHV